MFRNPKWDVVTTRYPGLGLKSVRMRIRESFVTGTLHSVPQSRTVEKGRRYYSAIREKKSEAALTRMKARCEKQARDPMRVEREIGRMLGKNSRAAKLFDVNVTKTNKDVARIKWSNVEATRDWATL